MSPLDKPRCFWGKQLGICLNKKKKLNNFIAKLRAFTESVYDPKNKSFQKYANLKGFSKKSKMAFFSLWYLFFVAEIIKFSYYAILATDDVIGCASTVVWHKIKNISAINDAMLLKLGRNVAPYEIYQMVHILMLLWQHACSSLLPLQNEILPFVTQQDKIPGLI